MSRFSVHGVKQSRGTNLKTKMNSNFRAVLRPRTMQRLEHWEIQRAGRGLFGWGETWEAVYVVATKKEAQEFINRMESEGMIYPEIEEDPS